LATKASVFIERIRRELEDYTTVTGDVNEFDATSDILRWVNDAIQGMYSLFIDQCPSLISTYEQKTVTAAAEASSTPQTLTLDNTVTAMIVVYDATNGFYLNPCELNFIYQNTSASGLPSYYSLSGADSLVLNGTYDEDIDYKIHYVAEVTEMAYDSTQDIDTESPFPTIYDRYIQEYVGIRAHNRNGRNPEVEAQFFVRFEAELLRTAEKRLPYLREGQGPWVV
jgi:hypothetical protein